VGFWVVFGCVLVMWVFVGVPGAGSIGVSADG